MKTSEEGLFNLRTNIITVYVHVHLYIFNQDPPILLQKTMCKIWIVRMELKL